MEEKTNVMRMLDQKKIPYRAHYYGAGEALAGIQVAQLLGEDPARVFKTLVTVGHSRRNYVFVIPVGEELDLKKAARTVGEKAIEMVKSKDLLSLTGYVHGGCSPIGMKKPFPTTLHESARAFDAILFSAGRIGAQVEVSPEDLKRMVNYRFADLIK
ncbi:Cys-tRNA(Pro) deacylase [Christensenella sp. MSJ-20]|uniref:Cys-tRNA(Pro) deacylase n=1 Tax=Christensenella sp. MSJ-20 TaxID=2841518 RepID=UPI001C7842E1|nr:Cys-tRNA(Pro) deacylase [Christensenella sp. MSJ-20]